MLLFASSEQIMERKSVVNKTTRWVVEECWLFLMNRWFTGLPQRTTLRKDKRTLMEDAPSRKTYYELAEGKRNLIYNTSAVFGSRAILPNDYDDVGSCLPGTPENANGSPSTTVIQKVLLQLMKNILPSSNTLPDTSDSMIATLTYKQALREHSCGLRLCMEKFLSLETRVKDKSWLVAIRLSSGSWYCFVESFCYGCETRRIRTLPFAHTQVRTWSSSRMDVKNPPSSTAKLNEVVFSQSNQKDL
ncbi:hypothetical protein Tco_0143693 [Tanacetum coccineum]